MATTTTDAPIVTSLSQDQAQAVADALQPTLVSLIDLALTEKQLHWAVVGTRFKPVHEHLDELVHEHREYVDTIAEYLSTVGIVPDGRAVRVASDASMEPVDAQFMDDAAVVEDVVQRLQALAKDVRSRAEDLEDVDLAAQDLLIELVQTLDKQLWMTSAMR